ncbi:kinase-like domain-containing protein, partial [Piptocephalis cylindrospora]
MAEENQLFALKCVKLEGASRDEQEMFMNEIDFLRGLRNKDRIVQLYDYEITLENDYIFMLMEIGDVDLASILNQWKGREKDMTFVRSYWKQMLLAVQSIHDEGIVHSDLKPANFLLVRGNLKLIDFGIAKRIPSGSNESCSHRKFGTADYMSPESLRDTREDRSIGRAVIRMGLASDAWSLGCILYQTLYDHTPFEKHKIPNKMHIIVNESSVIHYPEWLYYGSDGNLRIAHGDEGERRKGEGSSEPARSNERSKIRVRVNVDGIATIRACLQHDPKRRRTIPQLLQDPLL